MTMTIHGLRLANNSTADNFHVERLIADPTPVAAGRFWFNTTEKVMKYSTLDAGGAVVVKIISDGGSVATSITALQDALAAELIARANGDTAARGYTDTKISELINSAPAVLDTLQELAAALQNNPDIVALLRSEVSDAIIAAKNELKGTVSAALDTLGEVETAFTALDDRVIEVEGQVNGKIGTLTSLTTDAKDSLVNAINEVDAHTDAEVIRATNAELAIKNSVNAKNFTFQSVAAATEHIVTHNLNSPFLLTSIMVEGADLVYRNDLVPVEETGVNSFTVYLSESRKIKVSTQAMTNI